jgi:hypothetical protein
MVMLENSALGFSKRYEQSTFFMFSINISECNQVFLNYAFKDVSDFGGKA